MIKNEKQYQITKNKRIEFVEALGLIQKSEKVDPFEEIMANSIISQIEVFDKEMQEYDNLKNRKPKIIISSVERLPESLIKARIARGFTQLELAQKAGLKEQQIQRYESTNYESANLERLINIAKSMEISFEDTRLILKQEELKVEGYEDAFIRQATRKLQMKKSLLTV